MNKTQRETNKSRTIKLLDKLLEGYDIKKRQILITGHIDRFSALIFLDFLQYLETDLSSMPVQIIVNSCHGGNWTSVKHMHANLRSAQFPIFTTAKNFVESGALLLFAAGARRFAYRGTELFFHVPYITFNEYEELRDTDLKSVHDVAYQINQQYYRLLTEAFGLEKTTWQVRKWCEEERSWILTGKQAEEALRLGIVHEIINP